MNRKHRGSLEGRKKREGNRSWRRAFLLPICLLFLSKLPQQWPLQPRTAAGFSPQLPLALPGSDSCPPGKPAGARVCPFLEHFRAPPSSLNSANLRLFPFVSQVPHVKTKLSQGMHCPFLLFRLSTICVRIPYTKSSLLKYLVFSWSNPAWHMISCWVKLHPQSRSTGILPASQGKEKTALEYSLVRKATSEGRVSGKKQHMFGDRQWTRQSSCTMELRTQWEEPDSKEVTNKSHSLAVH